jgi:hypothetical protein
MTVLTMLSPLYLLIYMPALRTRQKRANLPLQWYLQGGVFGCSLQHRAQMREKINKKHYLRPSTVSEF